jgi:tetratricopeptide (TPR) repeat protein
MTPDAERLEPAEIQALDAHASTLMKRGIRLLGDAQPGAVAEALACFDRALELRRRLPFETAPSLRYGLAACWLNRADALMRLGDSAQIPVALRAYDEALVLLQGLPLGDAPRFPRRMAIAHQNRGLALHAQGGAGVTAAIAAFRDAIAILDHEQAALIPDRQYLLAAVWMNLAIARAAQATTEPDPLAREAALRAISLVAHLEAHDADAAEVGLKARHVVCQTIARDLALQTVSGETAIDDVHEATDVVDDGLGLVRHWEHHGVARFRAVAHDLFRFGARVYERYQPHFLDEFLLENTDPGQSSPGYIESAEMRAAAEDVRLLVRREGD